MAVETTEPRSASGTSRGRGNWFAQHKAATVAIGAGAAILLLGHKGSSAGGGSGSASNAADVAANAAAEQAAIDQAVGQAAGVAAYAPSGGGYSSDPGSSGGTANSAGLDSGTSSDTGSGSAGAGDTGTAPGAGSPGPMGGSPAIEVNVNNPASQLAANHPKAAAKPKSKSRSPAHHGPAKERPNRKPGTTSHKATTHKTHSGVPVHRPAEAPAPAHTPAPAAKHPAPAPKRPAARSRPATHKPRGSVMHDGRTFEGARAVRTGPAHVTSDGVTHQTVTIDYGGYTETHMSHNRGKSWTDHVPGMSPPSRGVPLIRRGTA